ncbi:flagellar filament capping protein FliD [Salidesulfovibrio onnuriiensis]|uniref:flagellar filament capping protein FliD n=1 Tax=Salidesulfovibrio onnuriiensis TaxID=2583823 RepID=UPI0011C9DCC6|nr:flagellar filament capping protein FliD [Salidesulfovibrio onnuriiensis]
MSDYSYDYINSYYEGYYDTETYTSGQITFSGVSTGTDFDTLIEGLVSAESYTLDNLENWKYQWEAKNEALSDLNTALISLQTALEDLDTLSEFFAKSASVTDSSALSVSVDADAQEATHNIVINQLAQNDIWFNTGAGYSATDEVLTSTGGTFVLEYAGESYTIDVEAGTTVSTFVNLINSDADLDDGVRAALVNDGDEYHLELRGMDLGEDNTISITSSTIASLDPSNFEQTQVACNSQIKVDGFPTAADEWIERDSNYIDDVLDGVALTLKDTTDSGGTTMTVSVDNDAIVENVQTFVEQFNTVISLIQEISSVDYESDEDEPEASVMTGNYGVDMVNQNLKDVIATLGLGFSYYDSDTGGGDYYSTLSQLGITTDADDSSVTFGQLLFDEEDFLEALEKDPEGVAMVFSANDIAETDSTDFTILSTVDGTTQPGVYDVEYTMSGGAVVSATIGGETCAISGDEITCISGDALGMALRVDDLTDGTYTGSVAVKRGKIPELVESIDEMCDSQNGILNIIQENYNDIIDSIDDKIDNEETRLEQYESRLRDKYSRLETTLSEYYSLQTTLESQLDQLE